MKLSGKVAIVTGAARGIGRACALRLAEMGADVAVSDINLDGAAEYGESLGAETVADEIVNIGRNSIGIQADLTIPDAAIDMVARTTEALGAPDILVNVAGGAFTPIEKSWASILADDDLDRMLAVNLKTAIHACQAVLPSMRERGEGIIVNTASMIGSNAGVRQGKLTDYGIAKTGVIQYTRFLAAEVGQYGIRVNALSPGSIATARIVALSSARGIATNDDLEKIALRRLGTPEDMASAMEFLVTDQSAYVTGQCITVCGGRTLTPS
ncbi:MAG: SDR family oxidoreductase [Rhodobiaceae bacterium]|nr:SDR family oxidoreductase [Rhodobiaceae bacterium]